MGLKNKVATLFLGKLEKINNFKKIDKETSFEKTKKDSRVIYSG